jgi:hypothetical protein
VFTPPAGSIGQVLYDAEHATDLVRPEANVPRR